MTRAARPDYDETVTIELARRLLGDGAPAKAVEAALLAEATEGVPFVSALSGRFPELGPLVERELARSEAPEVHWVRPLRELVELLPRGMCERLLAVPVYRESPEGRVEVAAVDTLGLHVAAEFSFHLGAPVRLLRAGLPELRAALVLLSASDAAPPPERRTPTEPPDFARGSSSAPRPGRFPSDAPIPLVRRPSFSLRAAAAAEPVINLTRSKVFAPEPRFVFERSLDDMLREIAQAESAEQVARLLCRALEPAAVLLMATRGGSLEVRASSRAIDAGLAASFSLPVGKNSVFDTASRAGFYLGPLPGTLVHTELRSLLPNGAADEVYSAPVLVSGRPALALLLAQFGPSLDATRRADRLIRQASGAIERIVLAKKRAPGH